MTKVLLIASGHSASQYNDYDYRKNGWKILVINNAWKVCPYDWKYWVRAPDFKGEKATPREKQVEVKSYGKQLKEFGGQSACGYSITLNAAYWCLAELKPSVMGFLGADMNYTPNENGDTHIYGIGYDIKKNGIPDPDRMSNKYKSKDQTPEQYLRQIYMRLVDESNKKNCRVVNLSRDCETRLPYERIDVRDIDK
jgi:hypothetical protein